MLKLKTYFLPLIYTNTTRNKMKFDVKAFQTATLSCVCSTEKTISNSKITYNNNIWLAQQCIQQYLAALFVVKHKKLDCCLSADKAVNF